MERFSLQQPGAPETEQPPTEEEAPQEAHEAGQEEQLESEQPVAEEEAQAEAVQEHTPEALAEKIGDPTTRERALNVSRSIRGLPESGKILTRIERAVSDNVKIPKVGVRQLNKALDGLADLVQTLVDSTSSEDKVSVLDVINPSRVTKKQEDAAKYAAMAKKGEGGDFIDQAKDRRDAEFQRRREERTAKEQSMRGRSSYDMYSAHHKS